jgi:hypothetical protein
MERPTIPEDLVFSFLVLRGKTPSTAVKVARYTFLEYPADASAAASAHERKKRLLFERADVRKTTRSSAIFRVHILLNGLHLSPFPSVMITS